MRAAAELRSAQFRRERQKTWRELERLVDRIEKQGLGTLSALDLERLPVLHRAAASGLSVARAISLDRNLLAYLESLTARSYFCVYAAKRPFLATVREFFAARFALAVRRTRWHLLLAVVFLGGGVAAGFALTAGDMGLYGSFVSEESAQGRTPTASTEELREVLYSGGEHESGDLGAFASFLFSHNARVGMLCFALGFAVGLPVFFLLLSNGLSLGAMAALYHSRGLGVDFWSWILPHGVTELLAIALCGGAGLAVAQAVVFPGASTRLVNLAREGRRAGEVVLGAVALFLLAALIEGFFRQRVTNLGVRYGVAAVSAAGWLVYFTRAGRSER